MTDLSLCYGHQWENSSVLIVLNSVLYVYAMASVVYRRCFYVLLRIPLLPKPPPLTLRMTHLVIRMITEMPSSWHHKKSKSIWGQVSVCVYVCVHALRRSTDLWVLFQIKKILFQHFVLRILLYSDFERLIQMNILH